MIYINKLHQETNDIEILEIVYSSSNKVDERIFIHKKYRYFQNLF